MDQYQQPGVVTRLNETLGETPWCRFFPKLVGLPETCIFMCS